MVQWAVKVKWENSDKTCANEVNKLYYTNCSCLTKWTKKWLERQCDGQQFKWSATRNLSVVERGSQQIRSAEVNAENRNKVPGSVVDCSSPRKTCRITKMLHRHVNCETDTGPWLSWHNLRQFNASIACIYSEQNKHRQIHTIVSLHRTQKSTRQLQINNIMTENSSMICLLCWLITTTAWLILA